MAASGALCAAVGTYPFSHSDWSVLLVFYWIVAAALISYAYALSTLFSKSRIAGTATAVIYACSMIPGCAPHQLPSPCLLGPQGWRHGSPEVCDRVSWRAQMCCGDGGSAMVFGGCHWCTLL